MGRVLRKLHLDELPQLFNVLRGEMSLVGPRPERPEFVCVLADAVPGYRNRLAVRPGVTGLAQINLPPDTDITSVQRKVILDCEYIERAGLWLDIRLLLCTSLRIFKLPERWLHSLLGLGRAVNIPSLPETAGGEGTAAETTPAAILLQVGNTPATANGETNGHGVHHGNGAAHHTDRCKHRSPRSDVGKPR